jgi:hypothetical protein
LKEIAKACLRGGEKVLAEVATKRLLTSAEKIEEVPLKGHYLAEAANIFFDIGHLETMAGIIENMKILSKLEAKPGFQAFLLFGAALSMTRNGQGLEARSLIDTIPDANIRVLGLQLMATVCTLSKDWAMFVEVSNALIDNEVPPCISTLIQLSKGFLSFGRIDEARKMLFRSQLILQFETLWSDRMLYEADIFLGYANLGETLMVDSYLDRVFASTDFQNARNEFRDNIYERLAEIQLQLGRLKSCIRTAQAIVKQEKRRGKLARIINVAIKDGMVNDCLSIVRASNCLAERGHFVAIIVESLCERDTFQANKLAEEFDSLIQ